MSVWMRHPDLDNPAEVPESSVPFHRAAGWEVTDAPVVPVWVMTEHGPVLEQPAPAPVPKAAAKKTKPDKEGE